MPRKPAGAVRRQHPPLPRRDDAFFHEIRGLSPRTCEAIRRAEYTFGDMRRGYIGGALELWRRAASGPACPGDEFYNFYDDLHADAHWEREYWLELALRRLPPFAAGELRRLLGQLDARHRRNDAT